MEFVLTPERKKQYESLLKNCQDIEANIGAAQYRIHKFSLLRDDCDKGLRTFWENTIQEFQLDPKKDYMISNGVIVDVTKPAAEPKTAQTVEDLK